MENEYMTTTEVIKCFRINKATLLKLVHEGKVRSFKVGKIYRYKKTELEEDLRTDTPMEKTHARAK
jgi:excisionase family DNA binding protein